MQFPTLSLLAAVVIYKLQRNQSLISLSDVIKRLLIFIVAPCILKIHLLSHTNKCTNYIIHYLKSVLSIDIKTLSYFHSSYMFRHITCHPRGALMFLAKITGKTICKT
jgi:hypothetical protein